MNEDTVLYSAIKLWHGVVNIVTQIHFSLLHQVHLIYIYIGHIGFKQSYYVQHMKCHLARNPINKKKLYLMVINHSIHLWTVSERLWLNSAGIIMDRISPQADKRPELKRLISQVKRDQERERARNGNWHEEDAVKRFKLPKKYMQLGEFVKCIQESGIVKDQGTIHRLFDALTVGK